LQSQLNFPFQLNNIEKESYNRRDMNASPNEPGRADWSPLYKISASNRRWL